MFIQTETTPNPNSVKFIPGIDITGGAPVNYTNVEMAETSPLAQVLFAIEHVEGVFLGKDFITITKNNEISWDVLKSEILVTIMDHFIGGGKVFTTTGDLKNTNETNEEDSSIVKQIKEIIETRVRPAVAMDGGDIIFKSFKDGVVNLELHGSCSGCPSSTITLKNGIESMLKHYVPEVLSVEAVS
jgi:Fe-S cluster biogenesis protein NfuA